MIRVMDEMRPDEDEIPRADMLEIDLDGDLAGHVNRSLDDVINLLSREMDRLKESLETYRLSEHPKRSEIIRWHVRTLDERQDALDDLKALMLASRKRVS